MSQGTEDLIRDMYAAWNANDEGRIREHVSESFEFSTSGVFPDFDPVYHGAAGFLQFREEMLSAWEYFEIEVRDIEIEDKRFVTTLHFAGKGRSSGVDAVLDFFHAGRVENGKLVFLASRQTRQEALEAAGLSK